MSSISPIQTNFTAGELTPRVSSRVDIKKYYNGAAELRNMKVEVHGGAFRRSGFRHVASTKFSSRKSRLQGFQFSVVQNYVIEFGDNYLRFYKDEAQIQNSNPELLANPNFDTSLSSWADADSGDLDNVSLWDPAFGGSLRLTRGILPNSGDDAAMRQQQVAGLTIGQTYRLSANFSLDAGEFAQMGVSDNPWPAALPFRLIINTTSENPTGTFVATAVTHWVYLRNASADANVVTYVKDVSLKLETVTPGPYEIASLWSESSLVDLSFTQSADVLFAFHPALKTKQINRLGDVNWNISDYAYTDGPYLEVNSGQTTLTFSAATGNAVTCTASALAGINGGAGFEDSDIGRHIRAQDSNGYWGWGIITGVTTSLIVTVQVSGTDFANNVDGAADSGTTTTMVDAGRTEATDFWNSRVLRFTSGPNKGLSRTIESFNGGTDTFTFSTAFPSAVAVGHLYIIGMGMPIAATRNWRLGAWSDTTGWPTCGTFFESRFYLGGTLTQPQTFWGSEIGNFGSHQPTGADGTVADSDAVSYTIDDDEVNAIVWMKAGRNLAIGTRDGEYNVSSSNSQKTITPTTINVKRETKYGSQVHTRSLRIGNSIIFIQRGAQTFREWTYDFNSDSYVGTDMTILSHHLTKFGIQESTFQQEPDNIIWLTSNDGRLIGVTYDRQQDIVAFHQHPVGGSSAAGDYATVESVTVIPSPDGSHDQLWALFSRTVNNQTVRYVEFLEEDFDSDLQDVKDCFFLDSGISYDGRREGKITPSAIDGIGVTLIATADVFSAADIGRTVLRYAGGRATVTAFTDAQHVTATVTQPFPNTSAIAQGEWAVGVKQVTGLDHLEGEDIQVLADGTSVEGLVVQSGQIVLEKAAGVIHAGLGFLSRIKQLRINPGNAQLLGKTRRPYRATILFTDTIGAKYGIDGMELDVLAARGPGDPMDTPAPLLDGFQFVPIDAGNDFDNRLVIEQNLPLPMTILAILQEANVGR